jgi:exosortase/archaeosortase family protein
VEIKRQLVLLLSFVLLVGETLLFRFLTHAALGSNISKIGMYARDVYMPLFIGCLLGCNLLLKQGKVRARFSVLALGINLICLLAAATLCILHQAGHYPISHEAFVALLMASVFGGLVSCFTIWMDFHPFIHAARRNPLRCILGVGAVGSLVAYVSILEKNWFWLIQVTGHSVYFVLRALGVQANLSDMTYAVGIRHPLLSASINMSCAGMEGMVFLFFAICLYFAATGVPVSAFKFLLISLLGTVFMFFVNIVRIVLFFCVSAWMNLQGFSGGAFFSFAFHQNIGWLLYLLAIAFFIYRLSTRPSHIKIYQ